MSESATSEHETLGNSSAGSGRHTDKDGGIAATGSLKATDRRTRYTKIVIAEAFFSLLREKGFARMCVTDICKTAQINRGTFYLHYEDKYALLGELIDEALDAGQILGANPDALCQRIPQTDDARLLYEDPDTFVYVARRVVERSAPKAVPQIMARAGIGEKDARTLFTFLAQGDLAVNQRLGWMGTSELADAQNLLSRFVEGGFRTLSAGDGDR